MTAKPKQEQEYSIGRGLDVGTANLVAAKMTKDGNFEINPVRNAFLDIQEDSFTTKMLESQNIPFIKRDGKLYIVGESAFELANVFNKETRRPMKEGMISPTDADAMPMEVELLKQILGKPIEEGEPIYFSIPADPVDSRMNIVYHESIVSGILEKLGYNGKSINEGHAVVFAELANSEFSGVACSFGGGMVNVCVAFKSIPVISFATSKGGDWIDRQAAQVMNIAASKITAIKEKGIDLMSPNGPEQEAITIYYKHLIRYSLEKIIEKLATVDVPNFPNPVPIVVSGGTSMAKGFVDLFRLELNKKKNFPIAISEVRTAEDQLNATAKGCLIAALSGQ